MATTTTLRGKRLLSGLKNNQKLICIFNWLRAFGIDPQRLFLALRWLHRFWMNYFKFRSTAKDAWKVTPTYPCLSDWVESAGVAQGHYFHQDLLVAQEIFRRNPTKHCDIGSRIDGFVAHVATYREIEVFDIRNVKSNANGIRFNKLDVTDIPALPKSYCDSLSSLHVLEHFGLGRYGDSIDPNSWRIGLKAFNIILQKDGILYLSVPVGVERVEFNAHRVFAPKNNN
jgi:hypothetical protein